jgi:hypothetical protein
MDRRCRRRAHRSLRCTDGAEGARTPDLLAASQTLSQLSYGPWSALSVASIKHRGLSPAPDMRGSRGVETAAGSEPRSSRKRAARERMLVPIRYALLRLRLRAPHTALVALGIAVGAAVLAMTAVGSASVQDRAVQPSRGRSLRARSFCSQTNPQRGSTRRMRARSGGSSPSWLRRPRRRSSARRTTPC